MLFYFPSRLAIYFNSSIGGSYIVSWHILFMQFLGFSLNLITLFALVLAIGIVVDNAIVVVEAVHAKMENSATNSVEATELAMKILTALL